METNKILLKGDCIMSWINSYSEVTFINKETGVSFTVENTDSLYMTLINDEHYEMITY